MDENTKCYGRSKGLIVAIRTLISSKFHFEERCATKTL